MKLKNPLSFTPVPVTIVTAAVYIILIVALLIDHHTLPRSESIDGIDLDVAWRDLQTITTGFHPFNSHQNDEIRGWLLARLESIVQTNAKKRLPVQIAGDKRNNSSEEAVPVTIFSDIISNISDAVNTSSTRSGYSTYFEGTNIIVYIRGSEDDPADGWMHQQKAPGQGGVLVSAHYDSVSTGYGATDDGVGIITILQLVYYFSSPGRQPKRGIVLLLNNGEEDFLNGARAFTQHPLSRFPTTFLNLEGAGAGGKATLFRSSTTEVTKSYKSSKHPFGSVVSADGFRRGLVRSGTDYSIFEQIGLQGLDVAFYGPRSRYHTNQDDTRHTSKASVSHMLSAALATTKDLIGTSEDYSMKSDGVWFDLFGSAFVVFRLHTLFALSVTLLVIAPATLAAIGAFLYRSDRQYILSGSSRPRDLDNSEPVSIKGRRGVFRWPVAFIISTAVVLALAVLIVRVNPLVIYGSPYAVWAMMMSAWLAVAWLCVYTADRYRPTAFQRLYTILWMSLAAWAVMIVATILEQKQQIAGTYLIFFYHAPIFLAVTVTLLEVFGLPKKTNYAMDLQITGPTQSDAQPLDASNDDAEEQQENRIEDDEEADERTSLIRGAEHRRTTFKRYSSPHQREEVEEHERLEAPKRKKVYGLEQPWSHALPSYLWILEFLLVAPFPLILLGQVSLLLTTALSQTLADGSSPLIVYLFISVLTILILSPLAPYLHRYTYHIPLFLTLVALGTLIYNLTAFPFSPSSRLKLRFIQQLDLDTGANNVTITGISHSNYLENTIHALPSNFNQTPTCTLGPEPNLQQCTYTGIPPKVIPLVNSYTEKLPLYHQWLTFNITTLPNKTNTARFTLQGLNTRACKLVFDTPISDFKIQGSGPNDPRFPKIADGGSRELRLWSRTWGRQWRGTISWLDGDEELELLQDQIADFSAKKPTNKGKEHKKELKGRKELVLGQANRPHTQTTRKKKAGGGGSGHITGHAVCLWSDANVPGTIPALDEMWKFAPDWVAVTKAGDGLVEGWKRWVI
ncbi:uncharacterized protein KY384_000897 [Bacidia gigantensis]|uniref:uncharacterized protein n=1 Tax=Bacidia gigantensis TaxID=2732470 RepID=UPI001D0550B5|nr:uncharacterized protein KY384_000897 [Bacidia gigantensis]KAG8534054.1 hypothetical protein KY384_000897 [Bacidia gigantensis]